MESFFKTGSSKRIDFILSGRDNNRKDSVIIIELKQWEKLSEVSGQDCIVETFTGGGNRRVPHPSYQAWSYASLIKDYNDLPFSYSEDFGIFTAIPKFLGGFYFRVTIKKNFITTNHIFQFESFLRALS